MRFPLREVAQALFLAAVREQRGRGVVQAERVQPPEVVRAQLGLGPACVCRRGPSQTARRPWWWIGEVDNAGSRLRFCASKIRCSVAGRPLARRGGAETWWGDGQRGENDHQGFDRGDAGVEMKRRRPPGNQQSGSGCLSLLRLDEAARVAVDRARMNHAGEIRDLAAIARPDVAVVTNVGSAHIENFDSVEDIAAAKRELIESLTENGTAVLNADDPRVASFGGIHRGRTILYGESPDAQVRAKNIEHSAEGVRFRVGSTVFESRSAAGTASNILAGIAVAGIWNPPERLQERVRTFARKMRGERFHHRGILVYDDCYNSNPDAVRAMLDVLRNTPARQRIAVLGEMLELGRWAEPLHRDAGKYAVQCGIDVLVGIRGAACHLLDAAIGAGLRADAAFFFDDPAEAGRLAREKARAGDAILFKGSRGVHVELALEQFLASDEMTGGRN